VNERKEYLKSDTSNKEIHYMAIHKHVNQHMKKTEALEKCWSWVINVRSACDLG
jgi:hypothetical protein